MRRRGTSWAHLLIAALPLIAVDAVPVRAQGDCADVFVDALETFIDETFDLRRNCITIRKNGGTCSTQPAERNERIRFTEAIEDGCTADELQELGPGGCAAEAADGTSAFVSCAVKAARTHVRSMLAPIFGREGPEPPPPTATPRPTPTGPARCARLNESCFGPGITGCCAPFQCRISGSLGEICALPPPTPMQTPSVAGAFLDGSPAGF
jgi:hypothetical protein